DEQARVAGLAMRAGSDELGLPIRRQREERLEQAVGRVDEVLAEVVRDVHDPGDQAPHHAVNDRASSRGVAGLELQEVDVEDLVSHGREAKGSVDLLEGLRLLASELTDA